MPVDYQTSATKTFFVGLLVGIAHITLGIAVFANPVSLDVTHLASLHHLVLWLGYGPDTAATILLVAGIAAVLAASDQIWFSHRMLIAMFLPQQILLLLQLGSIATAVITGTYPDGYRPAGGGWFILADQVQAWILATSHSLWLTAIIWRQAGGRLAHEGTRLGLS